MRRLLGALATLALLGALGAAPAQASFGFERLEDSFTAENGLVAMQAGSHPFAQNVTIDLNTEVDPTLGKISSGGQPRDLTGELPTGFAGSPTATPRCSGVEFATRIEFVEGPTLPSCSDSTVVGIVVLHVFLASPLTVATPVYNLLPPPGVAARLGFLAEGQPVTIDLGAKESPPYNLHFAVENITQMVRFYGSKLTIWGNPSDASHDEERGVCGTALFVGKNEEEGQKYFPGKKCQTSNPNVPFLTLPRSCTGPLPFSFHADTWNSGAEAQQTIHTLGDFGEPVGLHGCESLGFAPTISAIPTNASADSPSGLDVEVDVKDEGLTTPDGIADSDIEAASLSLPAGMTINPAQAEGLGVCSVADLKREKVDTPFGAGCPAASKIGSVEVETPLLEKTILKGSLFVATPYENEAENSLIALYMVIREPQLGLIFKLPGKVSPSEEAGPNAGRLTGSFDELPQYPFSRFHLHFREGGRSPLVTPPACGTYTSEATFTPTADPARRFSTPASFRIDSGPGAGPCPAGGVPPFHPGFQAGTINNDAGSYSPFYMRLTRQDGEQDLTKFSATLPPGVTGKIAGLQECSPAQIALAKTKTGKAELAAPSCPPGSRIGRVLTGAGVGPELTYVPGSLYLAGPYHGDPLSVVAIVPAVAGPFDVGTVVVQEALALNPRTAEVQVDGAASDPIPHFLKGILLKVRELEVYADRPGFTLNPTSCEASQTRATAFGSNADVFSPADDVPFALSSRFQAANCQNLAFGPSLALKLRGGTRRGAFPKLTATYTARPGDANLRRLSLRFPRSEFIEQGHFRTICTRVQYAAKACPAAAIYGHVRAFTPLLSEPLEGPVYLRSSSHNLPDAVLALHGKVDAEATIRIDSKNGGLRATVEEAPDVPVSKVVVEMQGGAKGLFVNSTAICKKTHRAEADLIAQNSKREGTAPALRAGCGKARKGGKHRAR